MKRRSISSSQLTRIRSDHCIKHVSCFANSLDEGLREVYHYQTSFNYHDNYVEYKFGGGGGGFF